jgi:hypothetical protein
VLTRSALCDECDGGNGEIFVLLAIGDLIMKPHSRHVTIVLVIALMLLVIATVVARVVRAL